MAMKTEWLTASPENVARAAEALRAGELVAFPTETVYGLGANALCPEAALAIFEAKGRPADNPLIVHIARMEELERLVQRIPERAQRLAEAFWPGPLTMILPKAACVPSEVTAGLSTVAVRMPSHPVARQLIECARCPIAAPSANRSGRPSPTTAAHVWEDMQGRIPFLLDGGACEVGLESTVLDLSGEEARVLRPGGVTAEEIAEVLGGVQLDESILRPVRPGQVVRSPGMKYRHYAPRGRLTIFRGDAARVAEEICRRYDAERAPCAVLAEEDHVALYGARRVLSLGQTPQQAAARLFDALRQMDAEGMERIYAEAFETGGIGLALMNRMGRAAAFDVVEV